jgi:hypothetical protein
MRNNVFLKVFLVIVLSMFIVCTVEVINPNTVFKTFNITSNFKTNIPPFYSKLTFKRIEKYSML